MVDHGSTGGILSDEAAYDLLGRCEDGGAILIVTPAGQSILIDAGEDFDGMPRASPTWQRSKPIFKESTS